MNTIITQLQQPLFSLIEQDITGLQLIYGISTLIAAFFFVLLLRYFLISRHSHGTHEFRASRKLFLYLTVLIWLTGFIGSFFAAGLDIERIWKLFHYELFSVGDKSISILSIIVGLTIFITAFWFSQIIQNFLRREVYTLTKLEQGIQYTITRLVHFIVIFLGLIIALQLMGLNLSTLTVIFGALSVGIGFGMQSITSNIISGLILLFERPIKVGDRVTVTNIDGDVTAIKLRSTTIQTPDNISIIIPNNDLINKTIVNWSHGDTKVRIHIPVGVAYGSDIAVVMRLLLETADAHEEVMKDPKPTVLFISFGDSSLNFELLAWIPIPARRPTIISDLNCLIDAAFRTHAITIPFPQQDVHITQK